MVDPRRVHWIATKHILRYLHCTMSYGLRFVANKDVQLQGYTNVNWNEVLKIGITPQKYDSVWDLL